MKKRIRGEVEKNSGLLALTEITGYNRPGSLLTPTKNRERLGRDRGPKTEKFIYN